MFLRAHPTRALACLGLLLVASACNKQPAQCPFIGDPNRAPEASLIVLAHEQVVEVMAGGPVLLEQPKQGGYVVYAGARVRNVSSCNVDFQGQFHDPSNGILLGFDRRQTNLDVGADGWGQAPAPEVANFPNINPCPDTSMNDVQGRTLNLDMQITDPDGRTVSITAPVVPSCEQADPGERYNCICTCSANYFLGKCNFGDGGARDAATD